MFEAGADGLSTLAVSAQLVRHRRGTAQLDTRMPAGYYSATVFPSG